MPTTPALARPLAVTFGALGAAKLAALAPMRARAAHLGFSTRTYRIVGAAEAAAAVGLAFSPAAPRAGAAAASGLLVLLAGAVATRRRAGDSWLEDAPALAFAAACTAYLRSAAVA